jgi:prophage antirepressor-like protein
MTFSLAFQNTPFDIIDRNGQPWLRLPQIGIALGYKDEKSISRIYSRHQDEFTEHMQGVVELTTPGGKQQVRVFSLRGAHLIGMLAKTKIAKEFRSWVLDALEGLAKQHQPQPLTLQEKKAALLDSVKDLETDDLRAILGAVERVTGKRLAPRTITPAQQRHIQARVAFLATQPGNSFQSVWRSVKDRFNVGTYKDIPSERFPELCKYLGAQVTVLEGEYLQGGQLEIGNTISVNYPESGQKFTYSFMEMHNCGWQTKMDAFLCQLEKQRGKTVSMEITDVSGLRKEFRSLQHMVETLTNRLDKVRDATYFITDQADWNKK